MYSHEKELKIKWLKGMVARNIGEILLHIDDRHLAEAADWIEQAIERDEHNGLMLYLGKNYASYAELLKRRGEIPKARETLGQVIEICRECSADGWVEKYEKELSAIS